MKILENIDDIKLIKVNAFLSYIFLPKKLIFFIVLL